MIDCSSVHASGIHVPDRWRKEYVVSDVSGLYVSEPLFLRESVASIYRLCDLGGYNI